MDELAEGRLLHLSPANLPLEKSLVEGVDRSRAAKEFIEHLMDLEKEFETRIKVEREALAALSKDGAEANTIRTRTKILEEMAEAFYSNLRTRMTSFFEEPGPTRLATAPPKATPPA